MLPMEARKRWRRLPPSHPSGAMGGGGRASPLRSVSSRNRIATNGVAMGGGVQTQMAHREVQVIGSGTVNELRVMAMNWRCNSSSQTVGPGNTVTIGPCYVRCNNINVQATWAGQTTYVMADGEGEVMSDAMSPSAFSLSNFTVATTAELRALLTAPANGGVSTIEANIGGALSKYYDPAVTTCTNINGSSTLTFTGTAPTTTFGASLMLMGRFASGDPPTWIGVGDSIIANGSNSFFQNAIDASPQIAGIVAGRGGGVSNIWTSQLGFQKLLDLAKYTNRSLEEFGTNSLGTTANVGNTTALNNAQALLWAALRSNARSGFTYKILRARLTPRTSGAWTLPDGSDQTPYPKYSSSTSDSELFEDYLTSQVGIGFDALVDPGLDTRISPLNRLLAAYFLWVAPGQTPEGLHPSPASAAAIATNTVRPAMDALA